jgi:hypothetical protein
MIRLLVLAALLLAAWPALAADCLTLAQARKAWPTSHLSYRSTPVGRCWLSGRGVPRIRWAEPADSVADDVPLPRPAPEVIRSPIEFGHAAFEQVPFSRPIRTIRITPESLP